MRLWRRFCTHLQQRMVLRTTGNVLAGHAGMRPQHACVDCRLLANLYNGTVYIWDYNDQVQGGIRDLLTEAAEGRTAMLHACLG